MAGLFILEIFCAHAKPFPIVTAVACFLEQAQPVIGASKLTPSLLGVSTKNLKDEQPSHNRHLFTKGKKIHSVVAATVLD
jgi:hypothetical protein